MAETHELRLKIDASAAKRGSREFTAAVNAVKQAVRDLERTSDGAFTKLRNIRPEIDVAPIRKARAETEGLTKATTGTAAASDRAAENIRKLAVQSANSLRVSTDQASRLRDRLLSVGDTTGLAKLEAGLDRLRTSLTNATSGLDVREARAAYADLASELNRTARESERLRAESIAAARAEEDAANAARSHATALSRLRAAHDPLYANSQRYEQALREIQTLEDAGALSASRAAMAREQASQSLLAASAANTRYAATAQTSTFHTANMAAQFNDIGVMLASGQSPLLLAVQQGTQVSQVLNQMGNRASMLSTLRAGFASMVNPVSLVTIGVIALGAAAVQALGDAIPPTVTFKDALDDLNESIDKARSTAGRTSDYAALREEYGALTQEVMRLVEVQRQLAQLDAVNDLRAARDALYSGTAGVSWMESLAGYADTAAGRARRLRDELDLTKQEATALEALFSKSQSTNNAERLADLYAQMRAQIIEAAGGVENLNAAQGETVRRLTEAEDAARRTTGAIGGAVGQTDAWAGAMAGVNAEIQAIASSLAAIGGGVISNAAKSAELTALQAGKSVKEAATARIRFEKEQEFTAKEMAADAQGGVAGWASQQLIEAERYQFERGLELDSQLDSARAAARQAARSTSSSGGARTSALTEERQAVEDLTESLQGRLTSLQEEKLALELVASGQFETQEGARAMAEAQMTMGGAVDKTTESLIRQIDAAQKTANEMRRAANSGAQGWLNSVPSYQEAADQIEVEILDSLSNEIASFIKTGEFSFERLADSILATMADLAAKLAVKELFGGLLGGSSSSGGLLSGLFGSDGGFLAGLFSEGGYSTQAVAHSAVPAAAFKNAPHFAEGGVTPNAPGGGIPAILHESEAVVPLSRNRSIPVELNGGAGGGQTISYNPTYNISTPDVGGFRKSQKQVTSEGFSAAQKAARSNT